MRGLEGKKTDRIFCIVLFVAAAILFLAIGSGEPVLYDDSGAYLRMERVEGVMPVYPMFILFNQAVFGDALYLQAIVVQQALLAALCLVIFVETVKRQFMLKVWESCLVFCFLLYPYTIEMPDAMITQTILTEGVAYSLFYMFAVFLLKSIWNKSYGWLAGSVGTALVLSLTRSQLQILFGVCGIISLYIVCIGAKKIKRPVRVLAGLAGCIVISLAGLLTVSWIGGRYQKMMQSNDGFYGFALMIQSPVEYWEYQELKKVGMQQPETIESADHTENAESVADEAAKSTPDEVAEEMTTEEMLRRSFAPSQYVSLIFSRGMYEADREDAALFEDELLRGLFLKLYETADAEEQLHIYAKKGLWMWRDIVDGIGMIGKTCIMTPSEYYAANYPEIILADNFSDIRSAHLKTIGLTLLRAHFGRFLYHSLILLPQAFISTVFFQMAPVYLLCHLVTLFLYLSAFLLMIWAYADRSVDHKYAEFMAFVLGTNVVLVLVISLIFYGQQRYLVYNFGIFYVAYCLLAQQLWRRRIKDIIMRRRQGHCI